MAPLLNPGDCCAGHQIIGHLGSGCAGSSEVYAATAPTGELRALKLLTVEGDHAAKVVARFAQEGEILGLVVNPHVVRVYDAGGWGNQVWLALEHVEGETLGQKLRAGARFSVDEVLHWIQQACEGLVEAHRVGVVHRDLTPDNLLVTRCGTLKVFDFGLAKLQGVGVKTTHEWLVGSARYCSPESLRNAPASAQMDVYSIGQCLYHLLSGQHPMGDEPRTLAATVAWQVSGQPRPLREVAPWVPADLEALVHQAFEKDPARRPMSMAVLNNRLREVRARLQAPQRRAARNLPGLSPESVQAPTLPRPVDEVAAPALPEAASRAPARGGTLPMAAISAPPAAATWSASQVVISASPAPAASPAPPAALPRATSPRDAARDRAAVLPSAWPTLVSGPPRVVVAKAAPPEARRSEESPFGPAALAEVRSTDAPVESAARRSSVTPRRAPAAVLVVTTVSVVAVAAAATGWMFLGRGSAPPAEEATAPRPAASTLPPAPAPHLAAPTATASASAVPATPPRPAGAGAPARTPPRAPAPAARPQPAKNRLFGTAE